MHFTRTTKRKFQGSLALAGAGALAAVTLGMAAAPAASADVVAPCAGQTFNTPMTESTCTLAAGATVNFTLSASFGGAGGDSATYVGGKGGFGGVVHGSYTNDSGAEQTLGILVADSGVPGTSGATGTDGTSAGDCGIVVVNGQNPIPIAAVSGGQGGKGATASANGANGADGALSYPTELPAGWTFQARGLEPSASFTAAGSILIAGTRDPQNPKTLEVAGETTGLVGAQVTPHFKYRGLTSFMVGTGVRTVDSDGKFTWTRKSNHKTYVFFTSGDVKSNLLVFAGR